MKLIECVNAYRALTEMMKEDWEFSFIYPLTHLMQKLAVDYDFFCREEMKLVALFGKKEDDGKVAVGENGAFCFADESSRKEYRQRHLALEEAEFPAEEPLVLATPPRIRGDWLRALLPFCDFQQEENHHGTLT